MELQMSNGTHMDDQESVEKLWLMMGVGLGTAAAIAFIFWGRSKRGLPTPPVQQVLEQTRHTMSLLDESLAAIETPIKHAKSP